MKTILLFAAFAFLTVQLLAQEPGGSPLDIASIPLQYQVYVLAAIQVTKWLAELYGSVRNGGGLKRILMSFWLGEQTPKVIADDYKKELSTPPFPMKVP